MSIASITAESNGAKFLRADLHIHSFGELGSYDVTDATMTPENIVDTAVAENLQVIAVTDHNAIGNVRRALSHATGKPLLVVPGVELSTPQGHFLLYLPTVEALEACYGRLTITPDRKTCHNTIPQCLHTADEFGGFGIAAHIDLDSGFEVAHAKYDAFKQDILNCRNLLGLEVAQVKNAQWYSPDDESPDRRNCIKLRCQHLNHEEEIEVARVMSSDAHTLAQLGRNARGDRRLTRFKMEAFTFDSLRIALMDCAARVRLEELIPDVFPHFVGMILEGGFLKDQIVHFSRNLTCIIGGRGAGKSTMLESLRAASGNAATNPIVDSEVWPDAITLVYQDETGQHHTLSRSKLNAVRSLSRADGPTRIDIESYGQGETAETIQHCDKDPAILLSFLDTFIDLRGPSDRDEELRSALLASQTEIERLDLEVRQIPEVEKAKALADSQLETLKQQKVGEVVELEQKLANERRFRMQLTTSLNTLLTTMKECLSSEPLSALLAQLDASTLAVGTAELDEVRRLLTELLDHVNSLSDALTFHVVSYTAKIAEQIKTWVAKEQDTQNRIEDIRRDLAKQKIKLDIAFIRKVTKDAGDHATRLQTLKNSVPKLRDAWKRRRELLQERREVKSRIFTTRQAFATVINKALASTVVEYRVTVRFHEGRLSQDLENLIKTEMGWRTSQVPRAAIIAASMSPLQLLEIVQRKNASAIEAITDSSGQRVFSGAEAQSIIAQLGTWKAQSALARCVFEDRPEVKVAKTVEDDSGKPIHVVRDFSQLSLGQQQSILLSILLFSNSRVPLIIDQPEDNLDSEFVYKTLIRCLRGIKEKRQVIVVTHNANIAVLGDAELIVPLRGASDRSVIRNRGSIDSQETKEMVCTILEGSPRAFKRRQEVYGF